MKKITKKRLIIGLVIAVVVLALVAVGVAIAVNLAFSKVSDTVGETVGTVAVDLPVLDENKSIIDGQSISVVLDAETIKKLEEKIPISEKLKVLTLLAKKLSPEDYSVLLSYAAGDVDNSKVESAYALMREKLGPEEKEIIKSYYAKYMYLLEEEKK